MTPTPRRFATPRPSATLRPTPTIDLAFTPPPTATFLLPTPSLTSTVQPALDCRLEWQSPGNGLKVNPQDLFTAGWKLTNTGTETWTPGSVEFAYVGGAKPSHDSVVQLKGSVSPGQSVILTAEMRAPRNSTTYTTFWSLRQGATYFCRVSVSIYVK